ncbi:hypothetical protein F4780DRAFT_768425 [Xylariomycetidae sp. FL0641]|nr:hypothetical protein F4780DRAFT_768425 [Xylariomycetidae sp. FL0641]
MVRLLSTRLLPLVARYGSVLLAAVLVFCIVRGPITAAFGPRITSSSSYPAPDPVGKGSDGAKTEKLTGAAAAAQAIREQNADALAGDTLKYRKVYKPRPPMTSPIDDPFPWLTYSGLAPPVLENNLPPYPHVEEATPLLIGFTRNWPMLLQCVASYIAAGWPPSDIYVVENTGVFRANRRQELSLQNPFFLNHTALRQMGVNVVTTPTLLTFAQLQNFFLNTAQQRNWPFFYWSHQDVLVFSDEDVRKKDRDHDWDHDPYATLYERAVGLLRYLEAPGMPPWATHFFSYDQLALVNVDAYLDTGGWDPLIPYYAADCDMYLRLHWAGFWQPQSDAGLIFDVAAPLDDVAALFRLPGAHMGFAGDPVFSSAASRGEAAAASAAEEESRTSYLEAELKRETDMWPWVEKEGESYQHLIEVAGRMQEAKWKASVAAAASASSPPGMGTVDWQSLQSGGQAEPFHRDPVGFTAGLAHLSDAGRRVFADKWGHRGCDLLDLGIEAKDAWRLERDWDITLDGPGSEGGSWGRDWMSGTGGLEAV